MTLVHATAKTRSVIEHLQARLLTDDKPGSSKPEPAESADDLEQELQAYFEKAAPAPEPGKERNQLLGDLRSSVIDSVVDRIITEWSRPALDSAQFDELRREVMDRLVERLLEELRK